jgi:hypothetical protein
MRSFEIPYLPESAPELTTPSDFVLALYPHQRRALHRMASIERDPSFLHEQFTGQATGLLLNYKVKGGCLSDLVGMGKTATVLALICSEARSAELGPNLLVAPTHLVDQWSREAAKFCPVGVRVVTGLRAFQDQVCSDPRSFDNRTLVVVDAQSVLGSKRAWYHWRNVYPYPSVADDKTPPHKRYAPLDVSPEQRELYRAKACFISGGYTGALFGVGGREEQALWFPHLVLGSGRKFRRVLFDEVQDLVEEGRAEKDCLLQLTQHALNVWLVTATPFPALALSVKANHELLGFKRLKLYCESEEALPADHPFEVIKRRLYIRSHEQVRNEAITVKHEVRFVPVQLGSLERVLYASQLGANEDAYWEARQDAARRPERFWADSFMGARASLTHLGATERLRNELKFFDWGKKRPVVPTALELAAGGVGRIAEQLLKVRDKEVDAMSSQEAELRNVQVPALSDTLRLCERLQVDVVNMKGLTRGWISTSEAQARRWLDQLEISRMRKVTNEPSQDGRKLVTKHEWLDDRDEMAAYMITSMLDMSFFPNFKNNAQSSLASAEARLKAAAAALPRMKADVARLRLALSEEQAEEALAAAKKAAKQTKDVPKCTGVTVKGAPCSFNPVPGQPTCKHHSKQGADSRLGSAKWGAKIGALVALLRGIAAAAGEQEQAVVFTAHLDAVDVLQAALDMNDIAALSLVGNASKKAAAIRDFSDGKADVLLACSTLAASGTNLQRARHVVFVDIPGASAAQASTLIMQAMGRVIRLGQKRSVTVHYLVVDDTIEVGLAHAVVDAIEGAAASAVHKDYTVEGELKLHAPLMPMRDQLAVDGLEIVVQKSLADRLADALNRAREEGEVLDLVDDDTPTQPECAEVSAPLAAASDTLSSDSGQDLCLHSSSACSSSSSAAATACSTAPPAPQGRGGGACSPVEVDCGSAQSLHRPLSDYISLVSSDDEASRSSCLPSAHSLVGVKRVKLESGDA